MERAQLCLKMEMRRKAAGFGIESESVVSKEKWRVL